jgi:anti-sigma factor RsiW
MSPDRLFDYLDGKLPANERAELEELLISDPQLRRELEVARRIHSEMRDSREVLAALEAPVASSRGAVLGRRIAILFGALVFLNVLFGLYAIAFLEKKRHSAHRSERSRQQVIQALENTAAAAMPTPKLDVGEVKVPAPSGQREVVVNQIIAAAAQCGGSADKNLSDENGTLVFAEVPAAREKEFRDKLTKLGAQPSEPDSSSSGGKSIIQIRVMEAKP